MFSAYNTTVSRVYRTEQINKIAFLCWFIANWNRFYAALIFFGPHLCPYFAPELVSFVAALLHHLIYVTWLDNFHDNFLVLTISVFVKPSF